MEARVNPLSLFSLFNQRDLQLFFPACFSQLLLIYLSTDISLTSPMNLEDRGFDTPLNLLQCSAPLTASLTSSMLHFITQILIFSL